MTKVFQILEEEKQEAINLAEKKGANNMIENFIKAGADTLMIMQATGLTKEEIEEIKKNMLTTKQGIRTGCHLQRCMWQSFCMLEMWYFHLLGRVDQDRLQPVKNIILCEGWCG